MPGGRVRPRRTADGGHRADAAAAHPGRDGGDAAGAAAAAGHDRQDCDPTASLRPFANKADADAAVAAIRARGRLIVGLDIGSNLFSFRDPITGEITGFDVDIAGEVARDIFGSPSQVEYRILSSAERITALQKSQVDIVVKTMTITCERRKQVNFSTVYLDANQRILAPRDSPIAKAADLSGKRVCVAGAPRRCTGSGRSRRRRRSCRW